MMIKSMTGFGSFEYQGEDYNISVDLKSVNHRYCEIYIKMPSNLSKIEESVRKKISQTFSRGKFECFIKVDYKKGDNIDVSLNENIVEKYIDSIEKLEEKYNLKNNIKLSHIINLPEVFSIKLSGNDDENLKADIISSIESAAISLRQMRESEGEKLYDDLSAKIDSLYLEFENIKNASSDLLEKNLNKLRQRISELLENVDVDENRLITEAGILADRACIDEEIVRFDSHINQLKNMLKSSEPVGRKMDFLIQEMNREINTIGSKTQDSEIVSSVVNLKSELEKIREQVQNVE